MQWTPRRMDSFNRYKCMKTSSILVEVQKNSNFLFQVQTCFHEFFFVLFWSIFTNIYSIRNWQSGLHFTSFVSTMKNNNCLVNIGWIIVKSSFQRSIDYMNLANARTFKICHNIGNATEKYGTLLHGERYKKFKFSVKNSKTIYQFNIIFIIKKIIFWC